MKKYRKDIIFWATMIVSIFIVIVCKPLENLDEIWNFNFARCIADGLVPYRQISMVVTPFSSFVGAIFLLIFGKELFVLRIIAVILAFLILFFIYKICQSLKISKSISWLICTISFVMLLNFFSWDYNFILLALTLAIIWLEIKSNSENTEKKLRAFTIGILAGTCFLTKQTVGAMVIIVVIGMPILDYIRNKNIVSFLEKFEYRAIGICIPVSIFMIYLLITNSFLDFISYTILGISDFSNKISYMYLIKNESIFVRIVAIVVPVIIIISIINQILMFRAKKKNTLLKILLIYAAVCGMLAYPISDEIHFFIASVPTVILAAYIIDFGVKKIKFNKSNIEEFVKIILLIFMVFFAGSIELKNIEILGEISKYTSVDHFKYVVISESQLELISEVDNYIENNPKDIYILDASAAVYMIPINRYNKNFDLFTRGNFGKESEQGLIELIEKNNATYLVLRNDLEKNWQNPDLVTNYVRENLSYKNSVGIFDIYEKEVEEEENLE